ncbi:MAG TPA: GntR family transcriptional regulator [Casimicrobiaceae bacterium]|nr:GntR family transcriptional regulator [Casimicrobiaceae bacterium]
MKLRDQAYQRFTRRLLAREIRAGQFVSQRELVALTGMPLGAIRELIPRLEADGLIRTVPQRGMQVAQVDVRLIRDAFGFRVMIEREAAAQFAQRAGDEAFRRLRDEHQAVLAAAAKGVTPALVAKAQAVDDGMHATIVDALGNDIVSNAWRVNQLKIRLIRQSETRLDADLVAPVMRVHLGVIDAIASRDPGRAAAAMEAHIAASRDRALGVGDPAPLRVGANADAPSAHDIPAGARSSRHDTQRAAAPRAIRGGRR